jgi:hypothetical protein
MRSGAGAKATTAASEPVGPFSGRRRRGDAIVAAAVAVLLAALPAPAGATALHPLQLGFADGLFASGQASERSLWDGRAVEAKASIVRVGVAWAGIAPRKPAAGFDASDPSAAGYNWTGLDATVREATAHGLHVLFTVGVAPSWAEGPGKPANAYPGAWRPDPAAFGAFATALATRYGGAFPDPLNPGTALPRVEFFEAWNEPNLNNYLSPQWEGTKLIGPYVYRELLDSFYTGVKAGQSGATVIAGSMAPFGDPPGGSRTPPVEFLRALLCLKGGRLKTVPCPEKAHFDVLSDHPIAVGSPLESAASPLDATTPDLGRLTDVLRRAEQTHRVQPAGKKPLWVTEFWYDSNPPDPNGVPLSRQARWYEQDLYLFWKQGARVAISLQLRDSPPVPSYEASTQAGAYFLDGRPKPSLTAFRFPFVAERQGRDRVLVWGIAPNKGRVRLQTEEKAGWRTLTTVLAPAAPQPFTAVVDLTRKTNLRAVLGSQRSLPWMQPSSKPH